jgi:hypothetical protein
VLSLFEGRRSKLKAEKSFSIRESGRKQLQIIIILNKLTLFFVLCVAFASAGLQRAAAQPQIRVGQAYAAPQQPDQTKVLRIYSGAGYFDNALAEKLRPMLDKAFLTSRTGAPKAVPGTAVAAPAKPESQMKVAEAAHR